MTTNDGTVGRYLGWLLVTLSLGAGLIHFAVAGGHFDVGWAHGVFFAVVAGAQVSWAVVAAISPTRRLLVLGVIGNSAVVATWLVSRVWGVPVGPDTWTSQPVSLADGLATGFEVGIVVISLAVLARPALAQRQIRPALGLGGISIAAVTIGVVSTVALSPSFASEHHGDSSEANTASGEHGEAADTADGEPVAGHAEGATNYMVMADGTSACERAGVANEGNSGHGNRGPVPFTPLDETARVEFAAQVQQANDVVATYATVADAEAAGWRQITPYVPCIAAHYLKQSAFTNGFDPAEPEILLYDGTDPESKIVGLSYLQFAGTSEPPEGFASGNDPWHIHRQLCIGSEGGGVLGDENTTAEDCEQRGGRVVPLDNLWMTHMWNVPGWDSRWGLFSSEHPDLGGRIGDINGEPRAPDDEAAAQD